MRSLQCKYTHVNVCTACKWWHFNKPAVVCWNKTLQHQELNHKRLWIYVYSLCYLCVIPLLSSSYDLVPADLILFLSCSSAISQLQDNKHLFYSILRFQSKERQKKIDRTEVCLKHSLKKWCLFLSEPFLFVFTWTGQPEPVQNLGTESERVALRPAPVLGPQPWQGSHLRVAVPIRLLHRCLFCRLCRPTGGCTTGNLGMSRIVCLKQLNLCAPNRGRWRWILKMWPDRQAR